MLIQTARSACGPMMDLNTASVSEIASLPYISSSSAELFAKLRPICSPQELTSSPKKIHGITTSRLNNRWRWYSDKPCSETCCLADASCDSLHSSATESLASRAIYEWQTTHWSDCSAACDTGSQSRQVSCFNSTHSVSNSLCLHLDELQPLNKQLCNTHKCASYEWMPHRWSTCHSSRNQCMQTRDVVCYNTVNNSIHPDAKCSDKSTPRLANTRLCDIAQCDMKPLRLQDGNILSLSERNDVAMDTDTDTADTDAMDVDSNLDFSKISMNVDLKQEYNHDKCYTSLYASVDSDTLIARRGCSVILDLQFVGLEDISVVDESWFKLVVSSPKMSTATHWSYKAGQITIDLPNNGHIAVYKYGLYLKDKSETEPQFNFNLYVLFNPYSTHDDVYMESDVDRAEYVENDVGLVWLGSSQYNQAKHWIYGQYEFKNLEVAMHLLEDLEFKYRNDTVLIARFISYAVGSKICRGNWGSGPFTTGHPYGGYECNDDDSACHQPSDWTGTSMILDVYRAVYKKTGRYYPVQYCQCWVFAGSTTTVGRALGIPTRSVTNFQSAHDTNFNRGIESYYILDKEKKTYSKTDGRVSDSVWNFHVWNEMYFKRNDFKDAQYNTRGWQIVDATPQETSYGGNPAIGALDNKDASAYQLGPAAKDQIYKDENPNECTHAPPHRKRFGCFDNEFVISEVNGDFNLWVKSSESAPTFNLSAIYLTDPFNPEYGGIGQHMSTKKAETSISSACSNEVILECEADRLDVTHEYKASGASSAGMPTNTSNYHKVGSKGYRRRMWSDNQMDDDLDAYGIDYEIEWIPKQWYVSPMLVADDKDEIMALYDIDASYGMMSLDIDSYFDDSMQLYCSFFVTAHNYRGDKVVNESVKEAHDAPYVLHAGQSGRCLFRVDYKDYAWILEQHQVDHFKFTVSASIYDGVVPYQNIIQHRNVLLCVPQYYLKDRIVCEKGLQWFAPAHNLLFDCNAEQDGVDVDSVADGFCDAHNNIESCYDGGDCCQTSCVPSNEYFCEYFDCVDHRFTQQRNNYMQCPQALSFIDYMNDVSVCAGADTEILQCSDLLVSDDEIENECLHKVYVANEVFGKIGACYDQTLHSIQAEVQPIIEFIVDCANTSTVFRGNQSKNDKHQSSTIVIVLTAISVIFVAVLVAVAIYLFSRRKQRQPKQPYDSPFLALQEQDLL